MAASAAHDSHVVDAIATMLGTSARWSGADMLEDIANLIGRVRPHPGDAADTYASDFRAATGRDVPEQWDNTPEEGDLP